MSIQIAVGWWMVFPALVVFLWVVALINNMRYGLEVEDFSVITFVAAIPGP